MGDAGFILRRLFKPKTGHGRIALDQHSKARAIGVNVQQDRIPQGRRFGPWIVQDGRKRRGRQRKRPLRSGSAPHSHRSASLTFGRARSRETTPLTSPCLSLMASDHAFVRSSFGRLSSSSVLIRASRVVDGPLSPSMDQSFVKAPFRKFVRPLVGARGESVKRGRFGHAAFRQPKRSSRVEFALLPRWKIGETAPEFIAHK